MATQENIPQCFNPLRGVGGRNIQSRKINMKSISFTHLTISTTKAKNEWGELIGEIVDKVNAGRVGTKYKPVTTGIILKKVKGFDTNTLRDFVKSCTQSGCFSKCFYGKLKSRKIVDN